jgi:hypothetical protein
MTPEREAVKSFTQCRSGSEPPHESSPADRWRFMGPQVRAAQLSLVLQKENLSWQKT